MNIIADRDIYPELIGGQCWKGKITDSLGQWYLTPQTRYEFISKWDYFLKESLPRADGEEPGARKFGEIIYTDGKDYVEYLDPIYLSANKIWNDVQQYQTPDIGHQVNRHILHKHTQSLF